MDENKDIRMGGRGCDDDDMVSTYGHEGPSSDGSGSSNRYKVVESEILLYLGIEDHAGEEEGACSEAGQGDQNQL